MDFLALKNEIEDDPEDLGYAPHVAALADSCIADIMNAPRYATIGKGSLDSIQAYVQSEVAADSVATGKSIYMRITEIAKDENHDLYVPALSAIQLFEKARYSVVDLTLTLPQVLLGALEQGIVITTAQKEAIYALATTTISRAEQLFGVGTEIRHDQIATALRG